MKKFLIGLVSAIFLVFSFVAPLSSFGYVASDSLYTKYGNSHFLVAPSNGVYLFHTLYKCNVSPSAPGLKLVEMLDNSYLTSNSGNFIWQGSERTEEKIYLKDIDDVAGFSVNYSYNSVSSFFVYSLVVCLPVVEGDIFKLYFYSNSNFVSSISQTALSFIPYGTGLSKVYEIQRTSSSESNEFTYTTKSDNQHLVSLLCPNSVNNGWNYWDPLNSTASNNLSFVRACYQSCDVYTTTYGLPKNSNLTLSSDQTDFSMAVYEIFTDGTSTPGIGESGGGGSGGGTSGDITVNVDMSETNSKLDSLIAVVQALPAEIWDCFKVGLGISSDSSSGGGSSGGISGGSSSVLPPSDSDMNLDSEKVDSVLDSVSSDMGSILERTRGAFNFFWSFTNDFIWETSFLGLAGFSLLLTTIYWLMNR